jgi:hypothetical protein
MDKSKKRILISIGAGVTVVIIVAAVAACYIGKSKSGQSGIGGNNQTNNTPSSSSVGGNNQTSTTLGSSSNSSFKLIGYFGTDAMGK